VNQTQTTKGTIDMTTFSLRKLNAATIAENAIETALKARTLETIAASRARLKHLPRVMTRDAIGQIVTQLALPMAAAASGSVDVKDLDVALGQTGLSTSDKIRLKSILCK
jgi:hypothetical protein